MVPLIIVGLIIAGFAWLEGRSVWDTEYVKARRARRRAARAARPSVIRRSGHLTEFDRYARYTHL